MKELYIVRHAKSSWDFPQFEDHERPLSKRGKMNAPIMAEYVRKRIARPQVFISSHAVRAYTTALEFLKVYSIPESEIIKNEGLYHASKGNLYKVISGIDDRYNKVMLFGHNPGLTEFVNEITGVDIYNIPTCGVAGIYFEINSWQEVYTENGKLGHYYFPKGINL